MNDIKLRVWMFNRLEFEDNNKKKHIITPTFNSERQQKPNLIDFCYQLYENLKWIRVFVGDKKKHKRNKLDINKRNNQICSIEFNLLSPPQKKQKHKFNSIKWNTRIISHFILEIVKPQINWISFWSRKWAYGKISTLVCWCLPIVPLIMCRHLSFDWLVRSVRFGSFFFPLHQT